MITGPGWFAPLDVLFFIGLLIFCTVFEVGFGYVMKALALDLGAILPLPPVWYYRDVPPLLWLVLNRNSTAVYKSYCLGRFLTLLHFYFRRF